MKPNHTDTMVLLLWNKFDDSRMEIEVGKELNSTHPSRLVWENKNICSIAINQNHACASM